MIATLLKKVDLYEPEFSYRSSIGWYGLQYVVKRSSRVSESCFVYIMIRRSGIRMITIDRYTPFMWAYWSHASSVENLSNDTLKLMGIITTEETERYEPY